MPDIELRWEKLTEADSSRLVEVGSIVVVVRQEEHSIAVVEEGQRSIADFVDEVSRTFWVEIEERRAKKREKIP